MFIRNPYHPASRLRFIDPPAAGEPAGGGGDPKPDEPKFPANTPVKEMTAEQQAAYWQHQARKHEDRVKGFGDFTPEKLAQLQQERDELVKKTQTADERAIAEAEQRGADRVAAVLAQERVKNALEKALVGRVPDAGALLDLDRSQFVKDGNADTDAIKRWVAENSTEATTSKPPRDPGQGNRDGAVSGSTQSGRELFENRKKKTTTS